MRPEQLNLLKISIHRSQIASFLNEILKFPYFHIKEFSELSKTRSTFRREHNILRDEIAMISHKINEIEENLIYIFQELGLDPDDIIRPPLETRFRLEVDSIEELIDKLHEGTEGQTRRIKGFFNDIVRYQEDLDHNILLVGILEWLQGYHFNRSVPHIFNQYKFGIFYGVRNDFDAMTVGLEHEDIPCIVQFKQIGSKFIGFFVIYHKSHSQLIQEIAHSSNIKEIVEIEKYLTEDGVETRNIKEDIVFCTERIARAKDNIEKAKENALKYRAYQEILENCRKYIHMEEQFHSSVQNQIVHLEAFVPTRDQEWISQSLIKGYGTKIKITSILIGRELIQRQIDLKGHTDTQSQSVVRDDSGLTYSEIQDIKVPSLVVPNKLVKPFKLLVDLYGTTNYTELDPTPIIAITYPILFGLMFGDVGHGLVLMIAGLLTIFFRRKDKANTMYNFGFLLFWLGLAAVFGGLLYGEFFGEELMINGRHFILFVNPLHNIIAVFKISILIGVIHINLGWFLSIVNHLLKKKYFLAFANPFIKIILLSLGTVLIFTWGFDIDAWMNPPYPILLVVIPAVFLALVKPIGKAFFRVKSLEHESLGEVVGESTVEVGETFLNILSNVASYSRLLALAMAHMGLMLIVTTLVHSLGNFTWLIPIILIFGNLFVIVLEGLLAGIHALRLHLYEFFGKFYMADGIRYTNVKIDSDYSEVVFNK
jgi:vacuolar-type H+-ATPase subunit I/STV1